jgi:5-methyltetrahydrofolate--homocysteine methyltransferase
MRAAARAAIEVGLPYSVTGSFDTAGRTMMGLAPVHLPTVFAELDVGPVAIGANCGVGASDLLVAIQQIDPGDGVLIAKSNCGVPRFEGTDIVYSGDPALMSRYATLAVDSGARIIGGCCGTSPEHLAEMKRALDSHVPGPAPSVDQIVATVGPLANPPVEPGARSERRSSRRRG